MLIRRATLLDGAVVDLRVGDTIEAVGRGTHRLSPANTYSTPHSAR